MLQNRVEGQPAETDALAVLPAAGGEVQVGTRKTRRESFTHTYAVVRLADTAPGTDAPNAGPIRTQAFIARPARPAGEHRPARRGRP